MLDLSRELPPRARRVAELGCGRGETGAAFLRLSPGADYWGWDTDEAKVHEAAGVLPHAFSCTPEEVDFEACGLREADVLLVRGAYSANLTPERLRSYARVLGEGGLLLLYMEEPGYLPRLLAQLAGCERDGSEPPVPGGMKPEAARALLEAAGWQPVKARPLLLQADREMADSEEVQEFFRALKRLCEAAGWQELRPSFWTHGWLWQALRREIPREERLVLRMALGEAQVTARPRVLEAAAFLETEPGVHSVADRRGAYNKREDEPFGGRIYLRQRLTYDDYEVGLDNIRALRRNGFLMVAEVDDGLGPWRKLHERTDYLSYAGMHAVQVSNSFLAEEIRPHNPHVRIFRNELRELPPFRERQELPYVTIFFGALNRQKEWQDIMPALNEAARRYGSRLRFRVVSDRKFYEALETEYKEFVHSLGELGGGEYIPHEAYLREMERADIVLLPLRDTPFNRAKSDLKFIEAAGRGAAVLASPTVYGETLRDGDTGFLYRSPREFAARLELLLEDRALRLEMGHAAWRYVRDERMLSQHYMERLDWYRELLARREELDRELLERLAQIAARRGR